MNNTQNNLHTTSKGSSILQWNIRGYRANYNHLRSLIEEKNPACICLQETCLEEDPPYVPRSFTMYVKNRVNGGPHGGAGILVRDEFLHSRVHIASNLEAIAVRIQLDKLYTVCSVYLSPNEIVTREDLDDLIMQLPEPFVMMGDVNARHPYWGDTATNRKGKLIESVLSSTSMEVINGISPTHFHFQTNSLTNIDLTIVSGDIIDNFIWNVCDDLYNSDHYPTFITSVASTKYLQLPKYIFARANWPTFKTLAVVGASVESFLEVDDAVSAITDTIIAAADAAIPKASGGLRKKCVPWWNEEIKKARIEKNKNLKAYHRSHLVQHKIDFMRARAKFRYLVKESKQQSWKEYVSSINSRTPVRKIWRKIDKIRGKYSSPTPPVLNSNGSLISEPIEVGNLFGQTLSDTSKGSQHPDFTYIRNRHPEPNLDGNNEHEYNSPFSMTEYENALGSSKNTAAGKDEIHVQMLKNLSDETATFVLDLFNRIWIGESFPCEWLNAIVIPFKKPGKDPQDVNNYRPISLTSCLCKLMERMVNTRLVWTLEKNRAINPVQCGFRYGRSALDVVACMESDIKAAFSRKEHTIAVFFDLRKAYDTTWRPLIIKNLSSGGIRGRMLHFINNFLDGRKFQIRIGSTLSNIHVQHQGVPQGSVLSCSLFSIAINNISECLPQYIRSTLYVDDFSIYASSRNLAALLRRIQNAVNILNRWSIENGFTFSKEKSVIMHFHKLRGWFPNPTISLGDTNLKYVEENRFLGMVLDKKLTWVPHMKQLKTKCLKALSLLKRLSRLSWGADRQTLLYIYRSIIRSKLDYGCQLYGSATKTSLKMLDTVHHQGIRISTGAFRTSPVESLYSDSGEPSLILRRDKLCLQMYFRIKSLPSAPCYKSAIDQQLDESYATQKYHKPLGVRARILLGQLGMEEPKVLRRDRYIDNPWTHTISRLCTGIRDLSKKRNSPLEMQRAFVQHLNEEHSNQGHIYTDGSKMGGDVGFACIYDNISTQRKLPSMTSIFSAELLAVLHALMMLLRCSDSNFVVFSDSLSALQSICDIFSRHPLVQEIHVFLRLLHNKNITVGFCWVPSHVDIEGNMRADERARDAALRGTHITDQCLPMKDYYPFSTGLFIDRWANEWMQIESNKLRQIKDTVRPWQTSSHADRRTEVTICRIRIGHTRLTHQFLLEGGERPLCEDCFVYLTIYHLIIECPNYNNIRQRTFNSLGGEITLRNLLKDNPATIRKTLAFLQDIGILNQL